MPLFNLTNKPSHYPGFVSAWIIGLIFGVGLIVSGMTNPAKVIGFLDVFGAWDPSLGFVMAGAILIGLPAFSHVKKHQKNLLGGKSICLTVKQ